VLNSSIYCTEVLMILTTRWAAELQPYEGRFPWLFVDAQIMHDQRPH
jgi:hypothetical protein